ncbi:hypothetical protein GQ55_8G214300 [Panicum hallii var. hallii]|uniref:Non-haem dioxygenase N-terminal domain-containing protein n=1 Tax=Panicum hallii var. hallii TaxID=1504633 RepID=A0A2T7CPR0_9POAL|nr:hypothetical protein GQ55_8G214300 [Panicum hallii var. hallii]
MAETSRRNPPQLTNGELSGGDDVPAMLSSAPEPCFGSGGIPFVDFDVLVNDAADQRAQAMRDLGRAWEDWGFFMVINHRVPESLQEAITEACEELLASPEEEKARYTAAGPMDPVRVGTGFYSADGGARRRRHYLKMFVHLELHCPAKPENLRDIAGELAARTRDLMLQLGVAISESLGLAGGRVSEALDLGSCFQMLVQNQYPACAGADDVGSIAPRGSPITPTTASSRSSSRTA